MFAAMQKAKRMHFSPPSKSYGHNYVRKMRKSRSAKLFLTFNNVILRWPCWQLSPASFSIQIRVLRHISVGLLLHHPTDGCEPAQWFVLVRNGQEMRDSLYLQALAKKKTPNYDVMQKINFSKVTRQKKLRLL